MAATFLLFSLLSGGFAEPQQSKFVVPPPPNIVTRAEWGSKPDPIPDSRKHRPNWITIHHAGVLWTNDRDPAEFVRAMQSWGKRRPQLEKPPRDTYWPDLPYHFLVAPDGRIFEGRPIEYEPESNTKYPVAGNIGVEMMGDFNQQRPTEAQLEACVRLTAWLMQQHKIDSAHVRTHRDAAPGQTSCPGKDFLRYIDDGTLKKWTETVLRNQPLVIDPGPALPDGPKMRMTDWPMFGGSLDRNAVNHLERDLPESWDVKTKKNVKWVVDIGSQSYGPPTIAGGRIFLGTNNSGGRYPHRKGDKGILLCLREEDGAFLWQAVHDKLPSGRTNDWPEQGVASTPCVDGDRVYYMSNRCELMCLDVNGFANGNQGVQDEQYKAATDADVIWKLDLMKELGVFPHNLAASSPLVFEGLVYVVTGNGVDETHQNLPAPYAPSFIAVDKKTGKVEWTNNSPGKNILHAQWSSPTIVRSGGAPQVVFPGGDGWLRAFEPKTGRLIWKFDCNPKGTKYELGGRGTRNEFVAPVVAHEGKIYATVGQDPEHGEGIGHLWCIDPSKARPDNIDVTPVNNNFDPRARENKNSGLVWHFGGLRPGVDPMERELLFRRSISCCVIKDGLCIVADLSGYVHCVNAATGERYWEYDTRSAIWGSPFWADRKVYLGTEDGEMFVFDPAKACCVLAKNEFDAPVYGMAVAANGVLYVKTRNKLYAIANPKPAK